MLNTFLKNWPWKEHPLHLFLKKQYKKPNNLKSWQKKKKPNPKPNPKQKNPQPSVRIPHSVLWAMCSQMNNRTVSWRRCSSDRSKWINQTKALNRFQRKKQTRKKNPTKKTEDRRRVHGCLWYTLQGATFQELQYYNVLYSLQYTTDYSLVCASGMCTISHHSVLFLLCPPHFWQQKEEEGFQHITTYRNYLVPPGSSRLITTTLTHRVPLLLQFKPTEWYWAAE